MVMNRLWNREVLRNVDAWACREGTLEDDEDGKMSLAERQPERNLEDVKLGLTAQTTIGERSEDRDKTVKD
jgi:hypothetical protein